MRYYVYVSDSKVDMLLAQMPSRYIEKVATELKLDIKLFGSGVEASRKTEISSDNRFVRVQLVERYLRDHELIGNVEQPAKFVGGQMDMSWAPFNADTMEPEYDAPHGVYFGGEVDGISIGLLGSIEHVVGARLRSQADAGTVLGGTADALFRMGQALRREPDTAGTPNNAIEPLWMVRTLNWTLKAPFKLTAQPLEFLAKPFWYGFISDEAWSKRLWVLVGSPLYVAFAD